MNMLQLLSFSAPMFPAHQFSHSWAWLSLWVSLGLLIMMRKTRRIIPTSPTSPSLLHCPRRAAVFQWSWMRVVGWWVIIMMAVSVRRGNCSLRAWMKLSQTTSSNQYIPIYHPAWSVISTPELLLPTPVPHPHLSMLTFSHHLTPALLTSLSMLILTSLQHNLC